jgi:hypothetical protein
MVLTHPLEELLSAWREQLTDDPNYDNRGAAWR